MLNLLKMSKSKTSSSDVESKFQEIAAGNGSRNFRRSWIVWTLQDSFSQVFSFDKYQRSWQSLGPVLNGLTVIQFIQYPAHESFEVHVSTTVPLTGFVLIDISLVSLS